MIHENFSVILMFTGHSVGVPVSCGLNKELMRDTQYKRSRDHLLEKGTLPSEDVGRSKEGLAAQTALSSKDQGFSDDIQITWGFRDIGIVQSFWNMLYLYCTQLHPPHALLAS